MNYMARAPDPSPVYSMRHDEWAVRAVDSVLHCPARLRVSGAAIGSARTKRKLIARKWISEPCNQPELASVRHANVTWRFLKSAAVAST